LKEKKASVHSKEISVREKIYVLMYFLYITLDFVGHIITMFLDPYVVRYMHANMFGTDLESNWPDDQKYSNIKISINK